MIQIKLVLGKGVTKETVLPSVASTKVVINENMFNWKHGGTSLVTIKNLGSINSKEFAAFEILRNHCLLISRLLNEWATREERASLVVNVENADDPQNAFVSINFIMKKKIVLTFKWSLACRHFEEDLKKDFSDTINWISSYPIEDYEGYGYSSMTFELDFSKCVNSHSRAFDFYSKVATIDESERKYINFNNMQLIIKSLMGFNAYGLLSEIQVSKLVDILMII